MTHFPYVWLSTNAQFEAYDDAIRNSSSLTRSLGIYRIRKGAAYTRSILMPWMRLPIVMVAIGELDIQPTKISYVVRRKFGFGWIRRNLRSDVAFDFNPDQIETVKRFDRKAPFNTTFVTYWAQVTTNQAPPLDKFYLAVGGQNAFAMSRYREQSLQIVDELQKLCKVTPSSGEVI